MRLNLKKILITGTSRGIGKKLARYYLHKDYLVLGCSRSCSTIKSKNYKHFEIDINSEKEILDMFFFIKKNYKDLDYLINNSGIASMNNILLMPSYEIEKVINVNFKETLLCIREALKLMKKKKFGRVINISSIHSNLKIQGSALYSASKSATEIFTNISAQDSIRFGVTMNTIRLSIVEGEGLAEKIKDEKINEILNHTSTKRFINLNDITNTIDFFLKKESSSINGQVISIG